MVILMDIETLRSYARLIVCTGANVQAGQQVVITAELDQPAFVELVAEECYKRGAESVTVDWQHQPLSRLHANYQSPELLGSVAEWEMHRLSQRAEILPAMIYLESEDPDGLDGIDCDKWGRAMQSRRKLTKPIRDRMESKYQWCIAAVPGKVWAKKVFPDAGEDEAVELLWQAILSASRAEHDGIAAWQEHNADLKRRCDYLNEFHFCRLKYKAANGTDFTVGLIPGGRFCAGSESTTGTRVSFNPNIPSEEVFTSPMKGDADGIVCSTRPLAFRGVLIENFSLRFEGGRVVEAHAGKNEDALKSLIAMDEGSCMLGECALVPYDSPIRRSGIMFYNTLFDENAACHLALGEGFVDCIEGYETLTLEQCRSMGINSSIIHEDFMIGSEDMDITGICRDGSEVPIFRRGNWAF